MSSTNSEAPEPVGYTNCTFNIYVNNEKNGSGAPSAASIIENLQKILPSNPVQQPRSTETPTVASTTSEEVKSTTEPIVDTSTTATIKPVAELTEKENAEPKEKPIYFERVKPITGYTTQKELLQKGAFSTIDLANWESHKGKKLYVNYFCRYTAELNDDKAFVKSRHDNVLFLNLCALERRYDYAELMDYSLANILDSQERLLTPQAKLILYQMLNGLNYLYQTNFYDEEVKNIHFKKFSLTPKNILINQNGLTKIMPFQRSINNFYCAPDKYLVEGMEGLKAGDTYSVGVMACKMFYGVSHGTHSIGGPEQTDLIYQRASDAQKKKYDVERKSMQSNFSLRPVPLKKYDPDLFKFINQFIQYVPRRVSIEDALENKYLKESKQSFEGQCL